MYGPYEVRDVKNDARIAYVGNKVTGPIDDIRSHAFSQDMLDTRLDALVYNEAFLHIHRIDNAIFFAAVEYFRSIGAEWCNLPLTTRMISSPGEVYAGKTLDYTTDTLPVDLDWFDVDRRVFLAESSQFYLELRLLTDHVNKAFSIYNSFRKEPADFCHLSEFQHIEFEGVVDQQENVETFLGLLTHIIDTLVAHERESLLYFLSESEVDSLKDTFSERMVTRLTFKEALWLLERTTGKSKYREFSMKHFGAWEEVVLTRTLGTHALVSDFPLLEIPFYHNAKRDTEHGVPLADNADLILYGYREAVGSGARIRDIDALREKAVQFNLPVDDYAPYLKTREYASYRETAGFGLGWQRLTHWLLKLPAIWDAAHVPRGHLAPTP